MSPILFQKNYYVSTYAYYMCSVTKEQCKFEVSHLRAKAVELGLGLGVRAKNFKLAEN